MLARRRDKKPGRDGWSVALHGWLIVLMAAGLLSMLASAGSAGPEAKFSVQVSSWLSTSAEADEEPEEDPRAGIACHCIHTLLPASTWTSDFPRAGEDWASRWWAPKTWQSETPTPPPRYMSAFTSHTFNQTK